MKINSKNLVRTSLFIVGFLFFAMLIAVSVNYISCATVIICDIRPTHSPEFISENIPVQYQYAIQDINEKRYENAKQRLEYIMYFNAEYLDAEERLVEVENILRLTPIP